MMMTIKTPKALSKLFTYLKWQNKLSLFFAFYIFTSFAALANNTLAINTMANVNGIVQDKKGFIWLTSQGGITRYDSKQTITFSSNNPAWPLPFNWLHDVAIDKEHFLLASEKDGLWHFDPDTGQAKKVVTDIERKSLYDVASFQGNYYISTRDKLYRYQVNTQKTHLIDDNIKIKEIVHNDRHVYISSKKGLYQVNNNKLTQLLPEPIIAITALSSGVIAITESRIYFLDHLGNKSSVVSSENIYAVTKEYHSDNFFTVSSQGIINKFSGKTLESLSHKFGNTKPVRIRSFLQDSSGVLWLVSTQGIEQLIESTIKNTPKIFDISINANKVALHGDDIIMGSYGAGLQNFKSAVFTKDINKNFTNKALRISKIKTINNTLYIATFDGLWQLDKSSQQVSKVDFPENDKLILVMVQKDNLLYLGTNNNGLYIYDLTTKTLIDNITVKQGLSTSEIIDVLPLNSGKTWLATSTGIDIIENNNKSIKNLKLPIASKVISLKEVDNKIFASTLGDGVLAFNNQGDVLAHFGQGFLFSRMLLVHDEVWVSGRPGLYRFNPKNYQLSMIENTGQYFFVGSNLIHNNIVYASHYGGILSLDLTSEKPFHPKTYISKTTISGKSYLLNKSININSGNDVITLDLASLDYRPGVKKQFRYRLNNSVWNYINDNQLTLTGLASGQYNIEIMATNSLGQWSNHKAYTEINVAFPWYWTPKIRITYVLILFSSILLVTWLFYLRSKSISYVHDVLKRDINSYTKISMQVKRNLTLAQELINQGDTQRCTSLLTQCLDDLDSQHASSEPNSLDGNPLSLAIPFLGEYLQHKYQVNLSYQLNIDEKTLAYELQADLYRATFEAISYAITKGSGRNFKVKMQTLKSKVWLNIYDDGDSFINFNNKFHFDISMYYIRQITNKYRGSINTFNEQNNGSQLVLSLPLNQHY